MRRCKTLCGFLLCAALAVTLFCQGCSIHFKATDVELESHSNTSYELEKCELFRG